MAKILDKFRKATRLLPVAMILLLVFAAFSVAQQRQYSDKAWSFAILADTQWTLGITGNVIDPEGTNPDFISLSIAQQMKEQFINHGVKFAFQLGDSSNWSGDAAQYTNATAAQVLYDAGIGYFPVRGNHDEYGFMAGLDGFNDTNGDGKIDDYTCNVPAFLDAFPQTRGLGDTWGATSFSSPETLIPFDPNNVYPNRGDSAFVANEDLEGLSYSFDYGPPGSNARFVMLDTNAMDYRWIDNNGNGVFECEPPSYFPCEIYGIAYNPGQQRLWISDRLNKDTRGTTQAFVMSHRGLIGANHSDTVFGSSSTSKSWAQNPFYASMYNNNVKHYISAHDHLYNRSYLRSLDGLSWVTQVISSAASTKFYAPGSVTADKTARETLLSQELYNVGYYIYTVDGPRVNVDHYSDANGNVNSDYCYPYGVAGDPPRSCSNAPGSVDADGNPTGPLVPGTLITPAFNFVKKESYGYSLNGQQFLIAQGAAYTSVLDSFEGTTAQILDGTNGSTATDYRNRPFVKAVNTGWTPNNSPVLASNILSLWGMADFGSSSTDVYVLSMSYEERREKGKHLGNAGYRLASLNNGGNWFNAVDLNIGEQERKFVKGPYVPGYELGTYGIDMATQTVWAVINYEADFAVRK